MHICRINIIINMSDDSAIRLASFHAMEFRSWNSHTHKMFDMNEKSFFILSTNEKKIIFLSLFQYWQSNQVIQKVTIQSAGGRNCCRSTIVEGIEKINRWKRDMWERQIESIYKKFWVIIINTHHHHQHCPRHNYRKVTKNIIPQLSHILSHLIH
jgi:hypothetical protein